MQAKGGRRIATVAAVLTVLALAVAMPASAGAITFGADLNNAPTNTVTCGQGIFPYISAPIGSPSCMYFSGLPGPSFYAPASGTVTAVRLRVGPTTGRMQIVVMRSLYQNKAGDPGHPYFACCFVERYGPVLVPQAGAVTTVATNLPMTEEPTPPADDFTTNAAGDFLALSVLESNVPVPLIVDNQSVDSGYYPAPTEASNPALAPTPLFAQANFQAGQIPMSADLTPGGGAGAGAPPAVGAPGAGGPGVAPAAIPALLLPKLTIPVRNGTATVPIQCLVVDCSGLINLQSAQQAGAARAAAAKKKPKIVSYGTAKFSLKAGKKGTVKIKLNAAGRKLLKGHSKAKVWANVRFSSGGGKPKSTRVTLKRS